MSLIDYEVENDLFIALDGESEFGQLNGNLAFPCCACKCNLRECDQIPCAICGHNATARQATCEDISVWMRMKRDMEGDGRQNVGGEGRRDSDVPSTDLVGRPCPHCHAQPGALYWSGTVSPEDRTPRAPYQLRCYECGKVVTPNKAMVDSAR